MKTDGVSGGRIRQALTQGRSLRVGCLRNREAGVMEQRSIGVLDYCTSGELRPVGGLVVRSYTVSTIYVSQSVLA
jgi:hypothetical protein